MEVSKKDFQDLAKAISDLKEAVSENTDELMKLHDRLGEIPLQD